MVYVWYWKFTDTSTVAHKKHFLNLYVARLLFYRQNVAIT